MPFDLADYELECSRMNIKELQKEWERYTRAIYGASASTTVSALAFVPTGGLSSIGMATGGLSIANAHSKRNIIERHFKQRGKAPRTRWRDVFGSSMFSATLACLTLGIAGTGADQIVAIGAENGIEAITDNTGEVKAVAHVAADGAALAIEDAHNKHRDEEKPQEKIVVHQEENHLRKKVVVTNQKEKTLKTRLVTITIVFLVFLLLFYVWGTLYDELESKWPAKWVGRIRPLPQGNIP